MSAAPTNGLAVPEGPIDPQPPFAECISESDREWLQPAFQAVQRTQQALAQAQTNYAQASGAFNYVLSRIHQKYNLGLQDDIDTETGVITRAK